MFEEIKRTFKKPLHEAGNWTLENCQKIFLKNNVEIKTLMDE